MYLFLFKVSFDGIFTDKATKKQKLMHGVLLLDQDVCKLDFNLLYNLTISIVFKIQVRQSCAS
jgi:hypothetical protein